MKTKSFLEHKRKCQYRKRILFYLKSKRLSQSAWCRQHGLDRPTFNRILNLILPPDTNWAYAIAKATNGNVPAIETLIEAEYIGHTLWRPKTPRPKKPEKALIRKIENKPKPRINTKHKNVLDPYS